jgi:hypothetical protein
MGTTFAKVQADIWKEGKLVEIGGDRVPGIVLGLGEVGGSTISVMVKDKVIEIMNPFWEGDVTGITISDTTSVAPIYLMEDDPYYELLMHVYDSM